VAIFEDATNGKIVLRQQAKWAKQKTKGKSATQQREKTCIRPSNAAQ